MRANVPRALVMDIFEGDDATPVLSHIAYGRTRAEAEAILRTHARYDSFLRAALTTRRFRGIPLRSEFRWG